MKKFLLSLCLGFVGLICFCSAEVIDITCNSDRSPCTSYDFIHIQNGNFQYSCFNVSSNVESVVLTPSNCSSFDYSYGTGNIHYWVKCDKSYTFSNDIPSICVNGEGTYSFNFTYSSCPDCPVCETCPEVNTGEILSGYILESDINSGYCVNNDLCPVYENNSLLYINTIEHQSAPIINIDIPLEYDWDSYIDSGTFNLVISGENVDYEYIDGIIRTQNSKPTTSDFNKIVSELIPLFIPGLVILLFLYFVFKFIKKSF